MSELKRSAILRATITKENLALKPVFCNPTPNSIDMNIAADRRPMIEIAGYNLTQNAIKVFLVGRTAPKTDVSDRLSNPSSYLLTLNLGSNGVPLSDKSDQILFELPNGEVKSISIIQPLAPPPKQQFSSRRIHVAGNVDMHDHDTLSQDENLQVRIDNNIEVNSGQDTSYHWGKCLDGEVQGYLDVQLQLDKDTGAVSLQGIGKYFEGDCGDSNNHGTAPFNVVLRRGESYNYLTEKLSDGDGHVLFNLTFKNEN
jgi:hypothetical protein